MKPKSLVLAGAVAQKPYQGGHTWVFLQYILGFRLLGWNVILLDQLDSALCRDRDGNPAPIQRSVQLSYLTDVLQNYDLQKSFCLLLDDREHSIGCSYSELQNAVRDCDLLLDFNGFIRNQPILSLAPCKVFMDIDPGFTQFWHELNLAPIPARYDYYATVGRNIGQLSCIIPKAGYDWIPISPPVVLEYWSHIESWSRPFTFICNWRGAYGTVSYQERTFGTRPKEFRKFVGLPQLSGRRFQLAANIDAAEKEDLALLDENGWQLIEPAAVAATPDMYRRFIQESQAGFEVAKNIYVETKSGWFSDRIVCYLASGKPAVIQDTGQSSFFPDRGGLLFYSTLEEAVQCVLQVVSEYHLHCSRARELAVDYFDSRKVIARFLRAIGLA